MKLNLFILITVSVLILSCKSDKEKQALIDVENLQEQNHALSQKVNGSFLDSVRMYKDSLNELNGFFEDAEINYMPDNDSLKKALHNTLNAQKIIGNFESKHLEYLNGQLKLSKEQLGNLYHDIDHRLLSEDEIDKFLYEEDSAMSFIKKQINSQIDFTYQYFNNFDRYKEDVRELKKQIETSEIDE